MMPPETNLALSQAKNLFGDIHSLLEQIGSPDGLERTVAPVALRLDGVKGLAGLKKFLENYRKQILIPIELPLVCDGYIHASRNEFSELIERDHQAAKETQPSPFALASKRIGQMQLKLLQPLRDQRGLQRYIRAVESGEAHGWHTLVYGITLASFSFPLRQGLLNYAEQTLRGFVRSCSGFRRFSQKDCEALLEKIIAPVPSAIDELLFDSLKTSLDFSSLNQKLY
jgi:urease accessory protein UreF